MKRALLVLVLTLAATSASADIFVRNAISRALANSLYCQLAGCTMTGTLTASFATPAIAVKDTGNTNAGFFGNAADVVALSINRNPTSGTITDATKAASQINLTGAAGNSNITFYTTTTNNAVPALALTLDSGQKATFANAVVIGTVAFAALGTPAVGTIYYCSDCTIANPCAGAGTGAFAKRLGSTPIWVCN